MEINKDFENLLLPLSQIQKDDLTADIKKNGCLSPLIIWDEEDVLLDGHNRFAICTENKIKYQVSRISLPSSESAYNWIITNQLNRRNVTPEQAAYLRGKMYNLVKKDKNENLTPGADKKRSKGNSCLSINTSEKIAEQQNVSERTVRNDGKYAESMDKLEKEIPGVRDDILSRKLNITKKDVVKIASMNKEQAIKEISSKKAHVSHNSGVNEWYTPRKYVEAARNVMGGIDCDPATTEIANQTVKADIIFTEKENGLIQTWGTNTWINPPYAQPLIGLFSDTIVTKFKAGEVSQACILVNNATETKWFQCLLSVSVAVCFVSSRIKFLDPYGKPGAPLQGQAILYMGEKYKEFISEFKQFGVVLVNEL